MNSAPRFTTLKLFVAFGVLVGIGLVTAEHWPVLVMVIAVLWAALALSGVTLRTLRRRIAPFALLIAGLAAATYFSRGGADAELWVIALSLRCLAAFLVGLWLVQTLTAREFLDILERCRVPPALVTTFSFMLRYLVVLWEEHERLRMAQLARAGGPSSGWSRWRAAIERLGLLLVRGLDRAERTHRALLARGWDGTATWRA